VAKTFLTSDVVVVDIPEAEAPAMGTNPMDNRCAPAHAHARA
jgi:hypothetical protein